MTSRQRASPWLSIIFGLSAAGCGTTAPQTVPPQPIAEIVPIVLPDPVSTATKLSYVPPRVLSLYQNARDICGPITGGADNPDIERQIQELRSLIGLSKSGAALLEDAAHYDQDPSWLCFTNLKREITVTNRDCTTSIKTFTWGAYGSYNWQSGILTLNTEISGQPLSKEKQYGIAIHELRHKMQTPVTRALDLADRDEALDATYIAEADAQAYATLVQWELKEAGHPELWNTWCDPKNFTPGMICYANLAAAFEKAIKGGTPEGATRVTFRAWYDNKLLLKAYVTQSRFLYSIKSEEKRKAQSLPPTVYPNPGPCKPAEVSDKKSEPQAKLTCDQQTIDENKPGFRIPGEAMGKANHDIGYLPAYDNNYLQHGGGVINILSHKTKEAASLRP